MVAQSSDGVINTESNRSQRDSRLAVSAFFLMHGLAFATWASRIPTIQSNLKLSVSALGLILFALPLGFFISLPFTGWLIAKIGSRKATIVSSIFYSIALLLIGVSVSANQVAGSLFLFGFFANAFNISMNTQAVEVEELYKKRLMATFHGLWSLAGFAGAAIGAWMTGMVVAPLYHFMLISVILLISISIFSTRLVRSEEAKKEKRPFFALPDKAMLMLGVIAFCSTIVEGAMFDWSGIYFKDIVNAGNSNKSLAGLGYTVYMIAMASMRFLADRFASRVGLSRVLQFSGIFMVVGLLLAVVQPLLLFAVSGFLLIGVGVSSVSPMVYSAAGKSKTMAPGAALTAVSSLGFAGFLIGPPIIGFVAEAITLRGTFLMLTIMATAVAILSSFMKDDK